MNTEREPMSNITDINTARGVPDARFVNDPDTQTLGDDFQCLRPTRLENGAVVLAYMPTGTKEGVVLAHWRNDEFVVWRCYWVVDNEGLAKWEAHHGDYFRGRDRELEAWQAFVKRAEITPNANDEEA